MKTPPPDTQASSRNCDHTNEPAARVRLSLTGEIALFVNNRTDRQLQRDIEAELGIEVDWCVLNPRRMQSAAKRVRGGRYSLVIVAVGFVGHSVEHVLGEAAKAAGVPFIRARRGRLAATVHALARSLDRDP